MADGTGIEWTNATWNPIAGCSIKSKGCINCYAMRMAARLAAMGQAKYAGLTETVKGRPVFTGKIAVADERPFTQPLRWKRPRRIFVNSMSDLFHENVSDGTIDDVFGIMALTPQHTYQVLTKRPVRMRDYVRTSIVPHHSGPAKFDWPLPNVWLGVSVEDQATADERIPPLLDTPAAVRWISAEPLLGLVDLRNLKSDLWYGRGVYDALAGMVGVRDTNTADFLKEGFELKGRPGERADIGPFRRAKLDWVVTGGESGPRARPSHPDWIRSLRDQCAAASVPFFFKQWGEWKETDGPNCREVDQSTPAPRHFIEPDGSLIPVERALTKSVYGTPIMARLGKKAAGATLDGREHREWPR